MSEVYRKLREKLDNIPIGFPESEGAIEILKNIFTPEEAELALKLPVVTKSLEEIAANLKEDPATLRKKLDAMADRGTVLAIEKEGKRLYRLLPSVVGFWETPFWPGKKDEKTLKLAPLWRNYFENKFAYEMGDRKQIIFRIIPVNIAISPESRVTPFEDVIELLKPVNYFAVAHCPCRQIASYTGDGCNHSTEVCLHFDSMGEYMVEHNMAREVTREETIEILRKANEEGLVHMTDNHQGKITTICNCCGCCCIFFRMLKEMNLPRAVAKSNYVSRVDPDLCAACGTCTERCPVGAITVDEFAVVDEERCVGCGVCYPTCPQEAIKLVRKPEEKVVEIPDRKTYITNLLKEKGLIK
ncbi:MAG: ATP-binding protein [Candidatus Jordarchaeum sp.]|uniref:ATP-binding protein n=1 Tax=Candidatus Jordarchaeum sp. TaxID=2823881 RepID=UPI00404B12C1